MRIGRLVRHNNYGWLGLVLDWHHTGRFCPGIELTVRWSRKEGDHTSGIQEKNVEYIDDDR